MDADRIKKNSIRYFDSLASENLVIEEPVLCYEAMMEELRSFRFTVLADIGCGTGEMLKRIRDEDGDDKTLYGVDISPKSIETAREALGEGAKLLTGDVDDLPLEDGSVDIVLNMHSFHHYPHPQKSLSEMIRVLKYGGYLLMVENDYSFRRRMKGNIYHIVRRHHQGDVRMYSADALTRMLRKAGFIVETTKPMADHSRLFICRK